ncbi:MAG: polysaccharide biosynthesis/export family protein [Deltaproteobacteria bacterium]|nr:polysaccharide biosynthesis/export family protein [Deltaproteobacteria bacterium]
MKKIFIALMLFLIPINAPALEAEYIIGPSDLLDISVWGEESLSRQVVVRTDGYVSLPLVGDIKAADNTPAKLQKDIEAVLAKFIKDPHCAVIVMEPRSKRFYIEGQINAPGEYILDRDMYLTQVIPRAGGFTEWADKGDIVILRYKEGEQIRLEVNYKKIIKGKQEDVSIKPGDTIIVP